MATKREALVASAEKSLQKGRADAALKDYIKVLEETPGDVNILNKVGDLMVRLNRNEESIPYFSKIAEHYGKDGFFLKAIAIYKKINKLDPARLDVYERLAELYAKQGLAMEAKSQYQVLADYHAKNENVIGAIGIYQKMVMGEPGSIQLHVKLADLFTQARRTPDALKEYAVVAALLRDRGAMDEAIQVYEKALKIAPDNVEILRTFVPLLMNAGRVAEARASLKRALDTTPRSVPLFLLAADAALAARDVVEARGFVTKAQAVEPENDEVLAAVVKVQMQGGRPDLAFQAASILADHAMKRGEAKKALALIAPIAEVSRDDEAVLTKYIQIAEAAGDLDSTLPYRSRLAEIWKAQGKIAEAVEALRFCARVAPDAPEFRARLAALDPSVLDAAPEIRPSPGPSPSAERRREITLSGVPESALHQAPKPAPAADEFVIDLEDEQLVRDPGSTGAVPAPIRRLSSTDIPEAKTVHPGARVPPPPAFGALDQVPPRAVEMALEFEPHEPSSVPEERTGRIVRPSASFDEVEEATPVEEIESGEALEPVDAMSVPIERPDDVTGARLDAMPLEAPSTIPPQPTPVTAEALEEALSEVEVFRKYGLYDKAIQQVKQVLARAPDTVVAREKLFELYLESGKKSSAVREAEVLKELYRAEGRDDRVRAIDSLLVERTSAEMGEGHEEGTSTAFVDTNAAARTGPVRREPVAREVPTSPAPEELAEVDFCLEQGMVVDASERLQALETRFPGDPALASRRDRLEGVKSPQEPAPTLHEILSEDFESVLDAELGRALSEEMARGAPAADMPSPASVAADMSLPQPLDESGLFSDEQEFFNFAGELQTELKQELGPGPGEMPLEVGGQEVSLEEIFREFKKGVEQQLSPEDYETHYNLGIAYKEMSLTDEAIGEFQKAAKDPLHAVECCSMLGICFLEKGLPQLAIKWYRKGLETPGIREDERLGLLYDLASVYADVGDRDNAYKAFLDIFGSNASFRDVNDRLKELAPAPGRSS